MSPDNAIVFSDAGQNARACSSVISEGVIVSWYPRAISTLKRLSPHRCWPAWGGPAPSSSLTLTLS
ncbi:MAG: hypothetical protein R3C45_20925 [Phycisphaerales bacterium]